MARPAGIPNRSKYFAPPGDWVEDALCNPHTAEYFFSITPSDKATALAICRYCPVRELCAEWAISSDVQGIWGGLTEEERTRRRREHKLNQSSDGL